MVEHRFLRAIQAGLDVKGDKSKKHWRQNFNKARNILKTRFEDEDGMLLNCYGNSAFPMHLVKKWFEKHKDSVSTLYSSIARYNGVRDPSVVNAEAKVFFENASGPNSKEAITKVVAILIRIAASIDDIAWLRVVSSVSHRFGESPLKDAHLPLTAQTLEKLWASKPSSEELCKNFLWYQGKFSAVILRRGEAIDFSGQSADAFTLPYSEEKKLGEGAYGTVYATKIHEHHVEERHKDGGTSSNDYVLSCARKDLLRETKDDNIREEWEKHNLIQTNPRGQVPSSNIIYASMCLVFSDKVSVFMELADGGDLKSFLDDPSRVPDIEPTWDLRRIIDIAEAVNYLHTGIVDNFNSPVVCCHLDLKPENILVKYDDSGVQEDGGTRRGYTLKLADFSVSKFIKQSTGPREIIYDATTIYSPRPRNVDARPKGSTAFRIGSHATCVPPETISRDTIDERSDIWSFGCVLSIFIVWLSSRRRGQDTNFKFRSSRAKAHPEQDGRDSFAVRSKSASRCELNPEVAKWFSRLLHDFHNRDPRASMYGSLWELLRDEILVVSPSARKPMSDIHTKLLAIANSNHTKFVEHLSSCTTSLADISRGPSLASVSPPPSGFAHHHPTHQGSSAAGQSVNAITEAVSLLEVLPKYSLTAPIGMLEAGNATIDSVRTDSQTSISSRTEKSGDVMPQKSRWWSGSKSRSSATRKSSWSDSHLEIPNNIKGFIKCPSHDLIGFTYENRILLFQTASIIEDMEESRPKTILHSYTVNLGMQKVKAAALTRKYLCVVTQAANLEFRLTDNSSQGRRLHVLTRRQEPSYAVEHIAAHPRHALTVACVVKYKVRDQNVRRVHVFRFDQVEDLNSWNDLHSQLDQGPQKAESSRRCPLMWEELPDHQALNPQDSASGLSLFFSASGSHLVLVQDGQQPLEPISVRWWTLDSSSMPRRITLRDEGAQNLQPVQHFFAAPAWQNHAIITLRNNTLHVLDLVDGTRLNRQMAQLVGPVFFCERDGSTFALFKQQMRPQIGRLVLDVEDGLLLKDHSGLPGCPLEFANLLAGTSLQLIATSKDTESKKFLIIERGGRVALFSEPTAVPG